MSDEKLLARLAAMETELSTLRARPAPAPQPSAPAFDPAAFRQQMINDPLAAFKAMGVPHDHITRILVAHGLEAAGQPVPSELRNQMALGPQINATMAMQSDFQTLRQRMEAFEAKITSEANRTTFSKLIADKAKYPHLAAAYAADPSLFDSDVAGHKGDAAALADATEARLTKMAAALGVKAIPKPASDEAADNNAQGSQGMAQAVGVDSTPPPIPQKSGAWSEAEHQRLRDEIVRKASAS
jgi:hypothetical protein